ncbi:MAG: lysophospholipid acyltransferase family protein [Halofilum sp. (in: g-proteobacteria)]
MHLIRRLYRFARLIPHLFRGMWHAATRLPKNPPPRTEFELHTVREWHRRALELAGVDVRIHGTVARGPVLFAANHVSWLDISGLATVIDAAFIGKRELQNWPLLGYIITRGGTIYIDRGEQGAAAGVAERMAERLHSGDRVAVFPEGTTSHGQDIRRFHPRLFEPAREANAPVQPVALRYDDPVAAFVDEEPFMRHVWRVLGSPRITLDIWLLPPIYPEGLQRRALARLAEQAVGDVVRGMPPPTTPDEAAAPLAASTGHNKAQQEQERAGDHH